MTAEIFDDRVCTLGEGPLWHPERNQLYWFDILGNRLMSRNETGPQEWQFDENISAAGWMDDTTLLIASETALSTFDLSNGETTYVHGLEADNPATRSNDGRADRWGGFWIGTMGKHAEPKAGAIYRFWKGELRKVVSNVSIPNAICFAPETPMAYYTDTLTKKVMCQTLDPETGWPMGKPDLHLDLTADNINPDGAVTDDTGNLWLAEWASFRVSCYDTSGTRLSSVLTGSAQTSCPAWGGPGLRDLYMTSAAVGLSAQHKTDHPDTGKTFVATHVGQGRAEPKVIL